jgi:hypothetical protein
MEEKQRSQAVQAMIFGCITAAASIVYSLLVFILNLYMSQVLQYAGMILTIGGMVWGAYSYRKEYLKGFMTYGQSVSLTFLIGLFASIIGIVYTFIYFKYINPGMVDELLAQTREKMMAKSGQMSEDQMDQALAMTAKFMHPAWMAVWGFLANAFFSLVLAMLVSIFMKKKDKNLQPMI